MNMTIDEQAGPNTAVFTGFNAERSGLVEHSVDLDNLDAAGYGALFNAGRDGFFSAEGAATPMARFEDQMMFREGWDPREKAERERVDAVSQKAEVLFLDMKDAQVRERAKMLHGAAFVDDFVNLSEEDKQHVAVRFVKDSVYGAGDDGYGRMAAEYGMPFSMSDAEWFSVLGGKLKETHAERKRVEGLQEQVTKESARVYEEVLSGTPVEEVYESFSSLDPEVQVKLYEALDLARENRAKTDEDIRAFLDDVFPEKSVAVGMEGLKNEAWRPSDLNELTLKLVDLRKKNEWAYRDVMRLIQEGADHVKENAYEGESLESKYKKQGLITPLDALEKAGFLRQIGANLRNIAGSAFDMALPYYDEESGNQEISGFWDYLTSSGASWDVLTNWKPLDVKDQSKLPMTKYLAEHYGKNDGMKKLSQEEMAVRNDLLGKVRDMQTSSGKDAWMGGEWRDKLAQGISTTLAFQASPWLILGSSAEDRMDQLIADGSSEESAILRGVWSGAVDVGSEYMFGLGKFTRWGRGKLGSTRQAIMSSGRMDMLLKQPMIAKLAALRVPGAGKFLGYMAGVKVAWRNKKFGSALLRYGAAAGSAGVGEMAEEYAGILAGVPGDFLLASAFGEDNATAFVDGERRSVAAEVGSQWKELSKDSGTWFSMMAMGALFAGANIGQFRRDALWSTMDAKKMRAFGLAKEEAERLANIANPEVRIPEVRKAIATNALSLEEKMRNVKEGFTAMDEDMEWLQGMAGYEDAVASGMLPSAERQEDGTWKMTVRVRNEAGEMVDAAPFVLDEKAATAFMQSKLDDVYMRTQLRARDNLVANAMVDRLAMDEHWKVRDMGKADSQASMERLATVARLRIEQLTAEGVADARGTVAPDVDADLTLGQAEAMAGEYGRRVELEKLRSRDELQRRRLLENERRAEAGEARLTDEEWDGMVNAMFRSAANRTPLDRGRTLLRYAKREVGTMDVLEEVIEDNFVREKMAGRSNAWWAGNFRKLQEEMKMPGAFLPDAGDVTDGHVIEAVSKLVKSDLLARAEKLGVSDWLKSFLRMIAKWVDEAMALCRLGRMFNELAAAGRLDGDFVREIHDFTGKTADYFKDLQEGGARDAVHGAVAAAVAVEDAADMRRLGLDAASFSMVDDSLDKADGDGVVFGYDERDSGSQDADAAFTSIEVDGRDSGGSSGGGEGMQRGRDSEFLPDDAATGTADRADGSELLHSVARRVERLGVRRHRVSKRDLDLARKHGFYTGDIVEVASDAEGASLFRECIEAGKASQVPYGECVYTYEAEEYAQMRLFLTPDGSAGFALKDGDMVSVFATKGSKLPGKPSLTMVALAVTQGATKGDCYGTMLPALYARFGFRAVARDEFNAEFSPESMQEPGHMERFYAKYNGGKPDIVYMVWDGSSRDSVIRDYDEDAASEFTLLPYAKAEGEDESAYDACVRIQNGVVEQFRGRYDAEELVSARESGDPMRLAAAMRGLRLSKADLKARDLVRGKMGSAATVGSLAGDALYGAFAEGKVPLVAAARIAAAAPMNDMLQEAALAELEHGELEQALATMQAVAALGASLDMEKARAMGAYALKKQEEKQKELDDARAKKMKLSEQDELLPLMAERERWRNWPVHPEMVAEVLDGISADFSRKKGRNTTFSVLDVRVQYGTVDSEQRDFLMQHFQASTDHLTNFDYGSPPNGWYVHGRGRRQDLDTGYVIQLTKNHGVASYYAGSYGSIWYVRPSSDAVVLDLRRGSDDLNRVVEAAKNDLNRVVEAAKNDLYDSFFPLYESFASNFGEDGGYDWIESEAVYHELCNLFSPEDIVDSAGAFDSPECVAWLYDKFFVGFVETPNGAVVIDLDSCDALKMYDTESESMPDYTSDSSSFSVKMDERNAIVEKAQAFGTYLKAPNGKETKLKPEQWVTVRTESFKRWFGDWEHDADNASKVVDENGEPLLIYHGSNNKFSVFDPSLGGNNFDRKDFDNGFIFASTDYYTAYKTADEARDRINEEIADNGDKDFLTENDYVEYEMFANIRNPLVFDPVNHPFSYYGHEYKSPHDWDNPAFAGLARSKFVYDDYDGIILKGEDESWVLMTEPNQLKSATDNRGTFDEGNPDITFSVRMDDAFSLLTPSRKVKGHAAFVNTILENIRLDVELWRRYEGLASTEREKALVAVGRAVNLVQAVAGFLPQKYRFSVNPYLRKLQVFSEMATTGDLDFTRPIATLKEQGMEELRGQYPSGSLDDMVKEYGERKLHEVMTELLQKTAGKLQRWGKDGVVKEIERLLDSVKPAVDEKSKMYKRGAVSAEAFRKVQAVEKLMEMSSEEKEAELERLEAALAKAGSEGEPTADLESDLLAVATFGDMDGMDMDQAAAAHEALKDLVTFERFAWDDVLERRRQEQKGVVSRVVRMFGGRPDRNRLHRAMEEKPRRDWKHLSQVLESMPQMLLQLERHDATREFGKAMRGRITDAGLSIKHAQKRRTRKVLALSKKFLGRKYWKAMRDLKEVHDTGIDTKRQVRRKVETTVSNARRLLEMTAEEREEERRRSAVEGGVMAADELTEQDVAEIGRFLEAREADAAAYERERMEWERMSAEDRAVTPVPKRPRDVKRIAFSYVSGVEDWKNIRLSKGQALYVILMSEQAHYSENLANQGFTEETLYALREWIGDGMVQFGYGLRDLFAEQGEKIAGVYEEAYGVPFPRVENYFAARFDVARMDSAEAEVLKGSGAMPGGGKGFMKLRQLHYHNVDLSRDALSVFMEATEISDNWLYTQDIVADFRAYFSDEAFKDAMIVNMGRDNYENMKQWVAMIETMGARQAVNMGAADRMTNRIYSGSAMAILGYKFETIVRQASGILNGWAGDPTIGFAEWLATMARMKHGKAPMTIARMAASEVMQDRYMGMLQLVSSQTRERHEKDLNGVQAVLQVGMNAMEKVDVLSNAVGMAAVYNIHYARAQKAGMTESEADVAGWGAVRDSLSMAAQPQQWMDRTKIAQMKSPLGKALLFMMSENFNKVGLISSLWKSGGKQAKMKAFKVWAAYGVFNALIGALLDFIKEDPDEWEKREWWGYIWSAVCGPLSGVPVVGEALEWAVDGAFKAFGIDAKVYIGSSARGVIDLKSGGRAVFNLYEMMFGDKEGEFEDYVKECVKLSRMGGVVGGAIGGTAGSAVILGSALMNPVKTATNFWHSLGLSD